jgi:predicted RNase H-like HicB family nuclease
MMEENLTAVVEKHGDWYVAYIPELPGVNTQGRTEEEARANLEDALRDFLAANPGLAEFQHSNIAAGPPILQKRRSRLAWASPRILIVIWIVAVAAMAVGGDWETLRRIPYFWTRKVAIQGLALLGLILLGALYLCALGLRHYWRQIRGKPIKGKPE